MPPSLPALYLFHPCGSVLGNVQPWCVMRWYPFCQRSPQIACARPSQQHFCTLGACFSCQFSVVTVITASFSHLILMCSSCTFISLLSYCIAQTMGTSFPRAEISFFGPVSAGVYLWMQQKPVWSSSRSSAARYPHQLQKIYLAGAGGDGWLPVCGLPLAVKIHFIVVVIVFVVVLLCFRIVANRYNRGIHVSSVTDG